MSVQKYPWNVSIYKGEGRILIVPVINHIGGYSIVSSWFVNIEDVGDFTGIGDSIIKALEFIKKSPVSTLTPKEREAEAAWKRNSKYKSWNSFWKNNNCAHVLVYEDGNYTINAAKRTEDRNGGYYSSIKKIKLPSTATAEEIGQAVIDVFKAAEEYYNDKPAYDPYPTKSIELLDGSMLTVKHPSDKHFSDYEDCGAGEIYQCYSYLPKEDAESSADFFVGIAAELGCDLSPENIRSSWEDVYGKADIFEIQEVDYGIFSLRVEMRNKKTHKISYLLQMGEDLLLECGMDVHQPNRRKKLDERLVELFGEFALSCKL